jgi:hypothetical protein
VNQRPGLYACHLLVAGCGFAISSSRGQYNAATVFVPFDRERVAALGFVDLDKRVIRPAREIEEESADRCNLIA